MARSRAVSSTMLPVSRIGSALLLLDGDREPGAGRGGVLEIVAADRREVKVLTQPGTPVLHREQGRKTLLAVAGAAAQIVIDTQPEAIGCEFGLHDCSLVS